MTAQNFPAPVVRELREKADRYRRRVRTLETALIQVVVAQAAERAGVKLAAIPMNGISVDDRGIVRGAAEAVATLTT